jgi:glycosyltransferase involved in cell wall biosynthesis
VVTAFQGVDTTVFHPGPASGRFADRFVIFSGGKLEFRKGQDIVVAAFRAFHERHPEALLLTAWHNAWTQLATDLDLAGHVRGAPSLAHGALQVKQWLVGNGIPEDATLDVGRQPNALMGSIVREADVAVFPNRGEGGTNLVAMECMAAGVPTIVSANTGHLDLVARGATPLAVQRQCPTPRRFFTATEGWGETDVEELVEALESVWRDREAARVKAARGADAMRDWSWPRQVDRLVAALDPVIHSA